jgi:hypothetical protein
LLGCGKASATAASCHGKTVITITILWEAGSGRWAVFPAAIPVHPVAGRYRFCNLLFDACSHA